MKGVLIVFALTCTTLVNAAPQRSYIEGGIDMNAIDWQTLCPSVEPVQWTRAGVTCKIVHPASDMLREWVDYGGTQPAPPAPDCQLEETSFKRWTTQITSAVRPWNACTQAFAKAIRLRSGGRIKYEDMAYEAWRAKYFAPWVVTSGGGGK